MTYSPNIDDAISALSSALAAMARREERVSQSLADIVHERHAYLARAVEVELLPAISDRVMSVLQRELPGFVTPAVQEAFARNRKFLGLFEGADYRRTLTLLRTKLASCLDKQQYGRLAEFDVAAIRLNKELATIATKVAQTQELVKLLQKAVQQRIPLPPAVSAGVEQIVRRAQSSVPSRPVARSGYVSSASSSANDDTDIWFYLVTDIPTSWRTLLYSAVIEHQRADEVQHIHGSADQCAATIEPNVGAVNDGHTYSGSVYADDVGAGIVGAATVIATDDSLGHFS